MNPPNSVLESTVLLVKCVRHFTIIRARRPRPCKNRYVPAPTAKRRSGMTNKHEACRQDCTYTHHHDIFPARTHLCGEKGTRRDIKRPPQARTCIHTRRYVCTKTHLVRARTPKYSRRHRQSNLTHISFDASRRPLPPQHRPTLASITHRQGRSFLDPIS